MKCVCEKIKFWKYLFREPEDRKDKPKAKETSEDLEGVGQNLKKRRVTNIVERVLKRGS